MKIKCIIIDDEPLARQGVSDYVSKTAFLQLDAEFKNVSEARTYLEQHPVDLIFLDINMPGENGLEFFKSLNDPPNVIFTTAYREFAADSYELDAADYLVKPIAFERFTKAVNKVYAKLESEPIEKSSESHFFVKVDGVITKVLLEDILFIEGMKDYVKIHRDKKSALVTLISLKHMEEQLPAKFIRVHRSFIVSGDKVDAIEGNMLKVGSDEIPMAPQLRSDILEQIMGGKFLKR